MKIRAVYWIIGLAVLFCGFWGGVDELCVKADQTQIDVWDGTSDTGWYDGNPTEGKVWYISTPEQLAGVGKLIAEGVGFEGQTIQIVNDIYLNEDWGNCGNWGSKPPKNEWTPITGCFNGTFQGQHYTIYGLYVNNESDNQGLFGYLYGGDRNTYINNINVFGAYVSGENFVGGIGGSVYYLYGCNFNGYVYGKSGVGGVVGCGCDIQRCSNQGSVTGTTKVGGIVGILEEPTGSLKNSCNQGSVTGTTIVGGLVGLAGSNSLISVAYVSGNVTGGLKTGILVGKTEREDAFCWDVYFVRNEEINTGLKDIGCNKKDVIYREDVTNAEEVPIEDITSGMLIEKLRCQESYVWGMEMGVDPGPVPTNHGNKRIARVEFYVEDVLLKVVYINCGKKLQKEDIPNVPKKEGYTFKEWQRDGVCFDVENFRIGSGEETKLYAIYKKAPVVTEVSKENPSVQTSESSSKTVKKKKKLKAPTFSLKKKKAKSGKRYIQIRLKKYKGKYMEIRVAEEKELRGTIYHTVFYKIKLKSSDIKKIRRYLT